MNILIIEEQPAYRVGLGIILQNNIADCRLATETSFSQALKTLKHSDERFDLILVGANNSSSSLTNQLKDYLNKKESIPLIVLTATDDSVHNQQLLDIGVTAIVQKQWPEHDMLKVIKFHNIEPKNQLKGALTTPDDPILYNKSPGNSSLQASRTDDFDCKQLLENSLFEFNVSADEEHTFLNVDINQQSIDLGERVHHYLLLLLARKRQEDHAQGFDEDSQGWIEISDLQKMLGLDYCHLNILIFRARQQVKKQLRTALCQLDILERRVGSIRFAGKLCRIIRAGKLESAYQIDNHSFVDYPKVMGSVA